MISKLTSQRIFYAETLLITAPASIACVLLILLASMMLGWPLISDPSQALKSLGWWDFLGGLLILFGTLVGLCAVSALVYLSTAFLAYGRRRLITVRRFWWWAAFAGLPVSLVGLGCFFLKAINLDLEIPASFSYGFPMALPLIHLEWERRRQVFDDHERMS